MSSQPFKANNFFNPVGFQSNLFGEALKDKPEAPPNSPKAPDRSDEASQEARDKARAERAQRRTATSTNLSNDPNQIGSGRRAVLGR
jgi:hypothetical protein